MPILRDVQLRDYAYYRTGGTSAVLYAPTSVAELAGYVQAANAAGMPLIPLGGGTNSLVMDEAFAGAFVVLRHLDQLERRGDTLIAGAGVDNSAFAKFAQASGLAGAAWMYRLPGQLGGTVRMNARCYGGEISQIVRSVTAVDSRGQVQVYTDPAMFRGYKDTVFMTDGAIIAQVELALTPGDPAAIDQAMRRCEDDRTAKGQFTFPSCGCVFKNDYSVGVPSGLLLEVAGAKALRHGGAEVSEHHANFVFNKGATSRAILELTLQMRDLVYTRFGVWLAYEMEILGTPPADLAPRLAEAKAQRPDLREIEPLRRRFATAPKT